MIDLATQLESLRRALAIAEGFTLVPLEVPGPDVGRAAAAWLGERGIITRVVEPLDETGWRAIVASVLDAEIEGEAAVMVIGGRKPAPGMAAGLRLINQRRDSIAQELGCPLVWCGPQDFLNATWERAPDFWSVRALAHRVELRSSAPAEAPLWAGVIASDAPERLRETLATARAQGDAAVTARVAIQLVESLLARGEYEEAAEVIVEARASAHGDAAGSLAVLAARASLARGEMDAAMRAIDEAEARAKSDPSGAFAAIVATARGNVTVRADATRALASYGEALAWFRAEGDKRNEAVVAADVAIAELANANAESALDRLEEARAALRDAGDVGGEARCALHAGRAHAALFDARAAIASFEEALSLVRHAGDKRTEARTLAHLASAYLESGDAEKAREDALRALDLARTVGDDRSEARANEVLARETAGRDSSPNRAP